MYSSTSPLLSCPFADRELRVFDTHVTISPSRAAGSMLFAVLAALPALVPIAVIYIYIHASKLKLGALRPLGFLIG
jgi:hypothetical protein